MAKDFYDVSIVNKIITLLIFVILIEASAFGKGISNLIANFEAINSSISCKVDIAPLKVKSGVVTSLGCYQSKEVSKPSLPVCSFFVLLPPNTSIKNLTITEIEQVKLDGEYDVRYVLPPIPIFAKNKALHSRNHSQNEDLSYPEKIVTINSIQELRGYIIACISAFAACYEPKTKQLTWNKQINFTLNLTKTKTINSKIRALKRDVELVKKLVVNPQLLTTYPHKSLRQKVENTYEYVVITDENLVEAFKELCQTRPMTTTITTTSWIYTHHQGKDNQERIKDFIKYCYENYYTDYVLLGGDVDIVPYRGVYARVTGAALITGEAIDYNIPCDLYYACFGGDWTWDRDKDGIYGELEDDFELMPEVYIGRAPVGTPLEVSNFVNKVISYENSHNNYIYEELLVAYKLDSVSDTKEIMEEIATYTPATYTICKEYESDGGGDRNAVINRLNFGVGITAHAGHATSQSLQAKPNYLDVSDVSSFENGTKTFIFNTIGCNAGDFSKTDCIGEEMLLNANGGAVAFVGNSRYGWYEEGRPQQYSGEYQIEFFKKFFKEGYTRIGEALAISKKEFITKSNDYNPYRWIMFCLNLLGDPTMEFQSPKGIFYIDHTIDKNVIEKPEKEVIKLIVTLKNLKEGTISDVIGTLTTTSPYITIVNSVANFGNIPSNGTATNSNEPYQIRVNSNAPVVHKANFFIEIGSSQGGYKNIDKFGIKIYLKVENLDKVIAYPNPCYINEGNILKIANIPPNSNPKVYIYNLAGELIRILDKEGSEIRTQPGSSEALWDAKNDSGKDVASGIYIYLLRCDVGTKRGKIAIIR